MERTTYRSIVRSYSRDLAAGLADSDLNPRERRLTAVMLNLASNVDAAACDYPPSEAQREAAIRHLSNIMWEARALILAVSPASSDATSTAIERAVTILRGV